MKNYENAARMYEIYSQSRSWGHTTAMLKAIIYNPNCVIIARNKQHSKYLETTYNELYDETFKTKTFVQRFKLKLLRKFGWLPNTKDRPTFLTLNSDIRGINKPIFFDNGCFF